MIALVEIGTRAIRLLVAEKDAEFGIRIVGANYENSPLNIVESVGVPQDGFANKASLLATVVARLLSITSRYPVREVVIFGTESLRRLSEEDVSKLRVHIPTLRILSPEEEARACHASSCLVAHMVGRSEDHIISGDIGSGSFELCEGARATPGTYTWYLGTDFGSNRLSDLYVNRGLAGVKHELQAALDQTPFLSKLEDKSLLLFSGSAATKFAWLGYRSSIGDQVGLRYDLKKIQGTVIAESQIANDLEMLNNYRKKDREKASRLVCPENPRGPELEILISGMQAISCAMKHTRQSQFVVNAYGGRHGIAWLKVRGLEF